VLDELWELSVDVLDDDSVLSVLRVLVDELLSELWLLRVDVLDDDRVLSVLVELLLSELWELSVLVDELLMVLRVLVLDDESVLSVLVLLDDWLDSSAIDWLLALDNVDVLDELTVEVLLDERELSVDVLDELRELCELSVLVELLD
jgi:hypothetical protein